MCALYDQMRRTGPLPFHVVLLNILTNDDVDVESDDWTQPGKFKYETIGGMHRVAAQQVCICGQINVALMTDMIK